MKYIINIISTKKFIQIEIFNKHSKMNIHFFYLGTHTNYIKNMICYRVDIRDKPWIVLFITDLMLDTHCANELVLHF